MKISRILFEDIQTQNNFEDFENINEYFEEYLDEVQNEKVLVDLFNFEKERDENFWFSKLNFQNPEKIAYAYGYLDQNNSYSRHPQAHFVLEKQPDGSFAREKASRWLEDISFHNRQSEYFLEDPEEKFNKDFWSFPAAVFHGTVREHLPSILKNGLTVQNLTRGITNKSVGSAIFTSTDSEKVESYTDAGGAVLKINTPQMKKDGYMPFVSGEPEIIEKEYMGSIAYLIGIEYETDPVDSGMDTDTVIFNQDIPLKYISVLTNIEENFGAMEDVDTHPTKLIKILWPDYTDKIKTSSEELHEEKLDNEDLMKKMGYQPVGKNYRLGSDTYIQNDDKDADMSKKYIAISNKNIEKSNPKIKNSLQDPSAIGVSLPKKIRG